MLYFAELSGKRVTDESGKPMGRLVDLVFLASGQPLITKLSVRTSSGTLIIPITNVSVFNGDIKLQPNFKTTEIAENELSVQTHLLNQQIIDIKGNKVVRVNDVVIQEKPYLVVAGVDVGILGIARWLNLEQFLNRSLARFGKIVTSDFLSWENIQPVELSRGKVVLKKEETKLTKLQPEDLADHLERLSVKNLTKILDLLPNEYEADVVQNLNISHQRMLFRTIKPTHAGEILSLVDPDDAVDILLSLPVKRREAILAILPPEAKGPIDHLIGLSTTDIGGLATSDFFSVSSEETAGSLRRRLKRDTNSAEPITYVYVLNKKNELVGVCNLHELILQDTDTPIYKFMVPNVVAVYLTTPPEIAVKKMVKYKIYSLPIINEKRQMLGIVTIDDIIETLQERLT
ncbi:MAG: CBS domain-containing protein [bacterium]|nr:CBS domain-containing protein [bacterium]